MKNKYLVIFHANWADEIDCSQFHIYDTEEDAEEAIKLTIEYPGGIGTNESFEKGQIDERDFEIIEITEDEAKVLERLLGNSFGVGLLYDLQDIKDNIGWNDEVDSLY